MGQGYVLRPVSGLEYRMDFRVRAQALETGERLLRESREE
jgi:hypothetical protein